MLRGVNLNIAAGERVALTGESGSGKSTLLHLIAGLDRADGGEIMLAGASDLASSAMPDRAALRRDRLGLVFQQFNLIPSLSVGTISPSSPALPDATTPPGTPSWWNGSGLAASSNRYPEQLSGGQQQRVAIGRALAVKPLLLLADEPTGNLDEATADDVLALTRDLVARTGCGFLMVTHCARLAATLDRQITSQRRADRMTRLIVDSRRSARAIGGGIRCSSRPCLIGLISATALWSGVQALNLQARDQLRSRGRRVRRRPHRRCWSPQRRAPSRSSFLSSCAAPAGRYRRSSRAASRSAARSFRLLGIEPVTLPADVGDTPAIGQETCKPSSCRREKRWWRPRRWPNSAWRRRLAANQ